VSYCEDYPCCGHGPPPLGDGGGCPDEEGRFRCTECGNRMPVTHRSVMCSDCQATLSAMEPWERAEYYDRHHPDNDCC